MWSQPIHAPWEVNEKTQAVPLFNPMINIMCSPPCGLLCIGHATFCVAFAANRGRSITRERKRAQKQAPLRKSCNELGCCTHSAISIQHVLKSPPVTTAQNAPRRGRQCDFHPTSVKVPSGHNGAEFAQTLTPVWFGIHGHVSTPSQSFVQTGGTYLFPPLYSGGNKSGSSLLHKI